MPDNEIGRVYHPTAEELLLLLSLLDDRPAPMLWPLAVPENTNWALTAMRLLQQGFATRTETALVPAPGLAEVLDHLKSADRIAAAVWKSEAPPDPETGLVPEAEQESTLYHSAGGCLARPLWKFLPRTGQGGAAGCGTAPGAAALCAASPPQE